MKVICVVVMIKKGLSANIWTPEYLDPPSKL